jgi:hypothetical protein
LPDPQYAERDEVSAESERLFAHEAARVSDSIRIRLKPGSGAVSSFRFFAAVRTWFGLSFVPRFIRNFTHRVRCQLRNTS